MATEKIGESHHPRPQWRSRLGFILAAVGSAIGLGNIWRFSYLCYENGGGAFLIPYVIALFVVGVPVMILEIGLGHRMRGSAPLSLARVNKKFEWLGWWSVLFVMYGIMLYYSTIIAWCVNYVLFSINLSWGSDPDGFFFQDYLQKSDDPFTIGNLRTPIVLALLAVWSLCWIIVFFGVQKGVERANKIFMPILFTLIGVLVIWCVNLDGAQKGLSVYLKPNFELLGKPKIWIEAFSQIFFTLSLGFGIMIAYASYLPRKASIVYDAAVISIGNCLFSFIAGFAVFGTLGYMAHTTNQPITEVVADGIGLAFVAYPKAIGLMAGGGEGPAALFAKCFGVLFFLSLVIAGISSAISIVEAFASAIIDKFQYSRSAVVSGICVSGFMGSMIFTANSGLSWVDIVDHFVSNYGLIIVGILECVLIGWIYKAAKLRSHINKAVAGSLNIFWDISICYITPVILLFLLYNVFKDEIGQTYGGYPAKAVVVIGPLWLVVTLVAGLFIAGLNWKKRIESREEG